MRAVSERDNDFTLPSNRPTRPHRPIRREHREYCAIRQHPFIFGLDLTTQGNKFPDVTVRTRQIRRVLGERKFKREAVDREVR
jgi:hypothetical protein